MRKGSFHLSDTPNTRFTLGRLKPATTFLFTALALAAMAWASDPPWKGKPYDQWTDKDLEKIFTDSPWARIGTVTRTWAPLTSKDGAAGGAQPTSPMPGARPSGPGGATPPSGSGAGGAPSGD